MIDRFRVLLDRPLDPSAARAILVLASAILVGFAALFVLAASEPDRQASTAERPSSVVSSRASAAPADVSEGGQPEHRQSTRRQDPQDMKGSAAGRRAARALRTHRALQHVPYRDGRLAVALVGARGGRAVLRVSAPTVGEARRGWRRFLRRYRDSGRAYVPIFETNTRTRGGA